MKVKITKSGQPCRKCETPVISKYPTHEKIKPGQTYKFIRYFLCPKCKAMYMDNTAKVLI